MRGLPKFLRQNLPGIEDIPNKNTERERKTCPKCGSVNIRYLSKTHSFRCENCKHKFCHAKVKMMLHDNGFCVTDEQYYELHAGD